MALAKSFREIIIQKPYSIRIEESLKHWTRKLSVEFADDNQPNCEHFFAYELLRCFYQGFFNLQ